jgi:hypothetical protein
MLSLAGLRIIASQQGESQAPPTYIIKASDWDSRFWALAKDVVQ